MGPRGTQMQSLISAFTSLQCLFHSKCPNTTVMWPTMPASQSKWFLPTTITEIQRRSSTRGSTCVFQHPRAEFHCPFSVNRGLASVPTQRLSTRMIATGVLSSNKPVALSTSSGRSMARFGKRTQDYAKRTFSNNYQD